MKIALTYTGYEHKHENYLNWLKGDDVIEIITVSAELNNAAAIRDCDALVLSGGVDTDPVFYNGPGDYADKPEEGWDTARDFFEKELYEYALKNSLPILAICRGLQLVNVVQGGSLHQDLGLLNETHKAILELDKEHHVDVYKDTLLSEIAAVDSGKINSAHHQTISELGEGLMINAMADDGTIEGVEWKDKAGKPFLLCVQWHPERMFRMQLEDSPLSKKIKERFIEEIQKKKK